ncbi:MAG TPA: BCAM0308 family protein [Burkholderiaceae bacterium]|nr:BCAM0308 family protein [Burkholderiaceae bacterium]
MLDETVHDPYLEHEKLSEPTVCSDCGAVYHDGRWQWITPPAHALQTRCTACRRIHEHLPAGYVSVSGDFASQHREEIVSLIRNVERREKADHPLQRVMAIEDRDGGLEVTTTDIHLARGIGEALQHAYRGKLDFHYNKEQYLLRLRWSR